HVPLNVIDTDRLVLVSGVENGHFKSIGETQVLRSGFDRLEQIKESDLTALDVRWRDYFFENNEEIPTMILKKCLAKYFSKGNIPLTSTLWFDGSVFSAGARRFGKHAQVQGMFYLQNGKNSGHWEKAAAHLNGDLCHRSGSPADFFGFSVCVKKSAK
ncbi:MAG: hypothetical protein WCO30_00990, partial [bacterium]